MNRVSSLSAVTLFATGAALASGSETETYAWVQVAQNQTAIVRVITPKSCEDISTATLTFTERKAPSNAQIVNLAGTLCEATQAMASVPTQISVDDISLTVPGTDAPERVLVLGDTGCRETPAEHQNCATDWHFKAIADASAELKPDLIVHVGDYTYRKNCGWGEEGCPGSDNALREWSVWEDDFFAPAQSLLAAAPWVFVRGNHEDCAYRDERAWVGWTQFFSPQALAGNQPCNVPNSSLMEHFAFDSGAARPLNLYVLNANVANYTHGDKFSSLNPSQENWILTHVPFWSKNTRRHHEPFPNGSWPASDLMLSGHVHLFALHQADSYGTRNAPLQVIQGASGVNLEGPGQVYNTKYNFSYEDEFSIAMIERDSTDKSYITLCLRTPSGGLAAFKSWAFARQAAGGIVLDNPDTTATRNAACVAPN